MKFTFRKLSALLLVLMLVCGLCVNAFAAHEYCDDAFATETIGIAIVECGVHSCKDQAYGYIMLGADSSAALNTLTCTGDMTLSYIYCREDMIKPSNYMYGSESENNIWLSSEVRFDYIQSDNIGIFDDYTDNVMLEATVDCTVDITTPNTTANHQFDPITAYYY